MDSEGTMSLRRGPGRPRRQGSGSPAERRRRSYITPEESPVSSPATSSPVPDMELSQADSPGPSTRSSQKEDILRIQNVHRISKRLFRIKGLCYL